MTSDDHISNRERTFAIDELFFSTTDERGFIQTGNEVFVRVSGYAPDELLGQPHNIIRHPHTPRVVFRLLWEYLEAGQPIAAYVKNRAKDGAYYWVLAAARPIERGYLSVRLKPTSAWFGAIQSIYAELHAIEADVERAGGSRREAMDASSERLTERLHEAGFADYGAFMRTALAAEVIARRDAIGPRHCQRAGATAAARSIVGRLAEHLGAELDSIEGYVTLNRQLADRSAALVQLAEEGQILALNAVLASRRLGADGAPLVAVAGVMQQTFPDVVARARFVVDQIDATRAALQQAEFAVALAVLQNDMASVFLEEIDRSDHPAASAANTDLLVGCLRRDVHAMLDTMAAIAAGVAEVRQSARDLERKLGQLAAIERNGRVEVTRTMNAESFASLLDNTRERVATTQAEIRQVSTTVARLALDHVESLQHDVATDLDALTEALDTALHDAARS